MSRFIKLERTDPYQALAAFFSRSRLGMRAAYEGAFAANERCSDLLREELFLSMPASDRCGFGMLQFQANDYDATDGRSTRQALRVAAQAEDVQADLQASQVALWPDDALQCFARGLGQSPMDRGSSINGVPFTTLLRATTDAVRHVSEWDDDEDLTFPYPPLHSIRDIKQNRNLRRAMTSIAAIQSAFGIGLYERIRDVVSFRFLVAVDGQLGTSPPENFRFETAMLEAAMAIAVAAGPSAAEQLALNASFESLAR